MANNQATNNTIPLKAKLNMNRNKNLVSSKFDLVQENNAPVYGNTLSPLYYNKEPSGGDNTKLSTFDRDGNEYYMDTNNNLHKKTNGIDEVLRSFQRYDGYSSGYKVTVEDIEDTVKDLIIKAYRNYEYDIDNGTFWDYIKDTVEVHTSYLDSDDGMTDVITFHRQSKYYFLTCDIASKTWSKGYSTYVMALDSDFEDDDVTIQSLYLDRLNGLWVGVATSGNGTLYVDGGKFSTQLWHRFSKEAELSQYSYADTGNWGYQLTSRSNISLSSGSMNAAGWTYPIIMSSNLGYQSRGQSTEQLSLRGVTILNKWQRGDCAWTDLYYFNFLMDSEGNIPHVCLCNASDNANTFSITTDGYRCYHSPTNKAIEWGNRELWGLRLQPGGRRSYCQRNIVQEDGTVKTETYYRATAQCFAGIFCEGTSYVVMASTNNNRSTTDGNNFNAGGFDPDTSSSADGFVPVVASWTPYYYVSNIQKIKGSNMELLDVYTGPYETTYLHWNSQTNVDRGNSTFVNYGVAAHLYIFETSTSNNKIYFGGPIVGGSVLSFTNTIVPGFHSWNIVGLEAYNVDHSTNPRTLINSWSSDRPSFIKTGIGYQTQATVPTTTSASNSRYADVMKGTVTDPACYNSQGEIKQLGDSSFRILCNYKEHYISGISIGGYEEAVGTIIAPWDSIDDSKIISYRDEDAGVYINWKDIKTGHWKRATCQSVISQERYEAIAYKRRPAYTYLTNDDITLIDGRYVLVNFCPDGAMYGREVVNCYDTVTGTWSHVGNDWNGREKEGYTLCYDRYAYLLGLYYLPNWHRNYSMASGYKVNYETLKEFSPGRVLAYQSYRSVSTVSTEFRFASGVPIDVYGSDGVSAPLYRYTYHQFGDWSGGSYIESKAELEGAAYPTTNTGSQYDNLPITGFEVISGYNGKFSIKMDGTAYNIVYDGVRPIVLYNTTSMLDDISEFFIIQSQYYAIYNNYICSVTYSSSGTISSVDQIVDVTGMQFIGAFPSVAYFYSPAAKCIYAFTGDADLQLFVQSDRISSIDMHLYAPNNEWIYLGTNDGLYVMTQMNIFRVPMKQMVTDFGEWAPGATSNKQFNIIRYKNVSGYYQNLRISMLQLSGYTRLPIQYETVFYGPGDMKTTVIDCWYLRFYKGDSGYNGTIKLSTQTLTDAVYDADTKEIIASEDMFDDNDNLFVRFQPQYQQAQGTKLFITSDYPIAYIGFSTNQSGSSTQNSTYNF